MSTSSDQDLLICTGSNSSNKKNAPANTDQDIISNLPECVISRILSSLPTQDAVRTSVLARAWKFKWTSIYNITIDFEDEDKPVPGESFYNCMDSLLSRSQHIKSFCFNYRERCDWDRVENWISSMVTRNVESFAIHCQDQLRQPQIVLPHSLISCTSLKELRVVVTCELRLPARNCFPNLTILQLQRVQILTETDTVRFDFPLLLMCELGCVWPPNLKCVEIGAPALTSFVSHTVCTYVRERNFTIKIDPGVTLARFIVYGGYLQNFLLTGSQVVTAIITNEYDVAVAVGKCEIQFRRLLNEFSSIEKLTVSCLVAQAIAKTKCELPLRKYDKLIRLKLSGSCSWGNHHATYDALLELLHAAPYLKFLWVCMCCVLAYSEDDAYDFDAVVSVPSCILSHLEELTISCLKVDERHLDLTKFLLKNGSKLKKFFPRVPVEDKDGLEDVLLELPKGSQCVSIVTTYLS